MVITRFLPSSKAPFAVILAVVTIALARAECVPSTFEPTAEITTSLGQFYVDHTCNGFCDGAADVAVVVYEESNGITGLQRQDSFQQQACELVPPDRLIAQASTFMS